MITIYNDDDRVLSPADVERLTDVGGRWPFMTELVVTTHASSRDDLEVVAHAHVQRSDAFVIALDPVHRFTVTRFGDGARVPPEAWGPITHVGDAFFRRGQWADGIIAIGEKASELKREEAPASTEVVVVHQGPSLAVKVVLAAIGVSALAAIAVAVLLAYRARRREREAQARARELDGELADARLRREEAESFDARLRQSTRQAPSTVVVSTTCRGGGGGGGVSDFASGMMVGSTFERSREPAFEPSPEAPASPPSNHDTGGGGSDWGSSFDTGGGSSDFGGGGGGDAGGGGSSW